MRGGSVRRTTCSVCGCKLDPDRPMYLQARCRPCHNNKSQIYHRRREAKKAAARQRAMFEKEQIDKRELQRRIAIASRFKRTRHGAELQDQMEGLDFLVIGIRGQQRIA